MFLVALFSRCYWMVGSILGGILGQIIPFDLTGIDFCMTALFLIIFIDQWEKAKKHTPALTGLGIGVICLAILAMAFNGRASSRKGIVLALINACFIAGYTLVDGTGVRLAGSALGYTLWTFFMNGFCLLCWAMVARRREASRYLRQHWKKGILGGIAAGAILLRLA